MELKIERGHRREEMRVPRHNHPAQTTLATILCGTRHKYASRRALVLTEYLRKTRQGKMRGEEDSMQHMLARYDLGKRVKTGHASASFLARMAKTPIPLILEVSIPKFAL